MKSKGFLIILALSFGCSSNTELINYYSRNSWDLETALRQLKRAIPVNNIDEIRNMISHFKLPDYEVSEELECESVSYTLLVKSDGEIEGFFASKSINQSIDSLIHKALISAKFKPQLTSNSNKRIFSILFPFTFGQGKISSLLIADLKKPPSEGNPQQKDLIVPFDSPPTPVGGFTAIQRRLKYPESARIMGVEGTVILQLIVLNSGKVGPYKVLDSPSELLTKAAYKAASQVKWKPATRDGNPCTVWVAIPIIFRFKQG